MSLEEIAKKMCAKGKGILAADESTGTMDKRLKSVLQKKIGYILERPFLLPRLWKIILVELFCLMKLLDRK